MACTTRVFSSAREVVLDLPGRGAWRCGCRSRSGGLLGAAERSGRTVAAGFGAGALRQDPCTVGAPHDGGESLRAVLMARKTPPAITSGA